MGRPRQRRPSHAWFRTPGARSRHRGGRGFAARVRVALRRSARTMRHGADGVGTRATGVIRLGTRRPQLAAAAAIAILGASLLLQAPRAATFPVRPYDPGRAFTLDTNLRSLSGLTASEIDAYLANRTSLPPLGGVFIAAERAYGVNARYLVAHAVHESGRGTSILARTYHNLFGWNAVDADPGAATRFETDAECVDAVARAIETMYLTPGGRWWSGAPTLRAMNVRYASDPEWGSKVAALANEIP